MDKVIFNIGGVDIEMDKEQASKALEAGKVELQSDDLVLYKSDDFDKFKTNLANEEYKKGKAAGEEMPFKFEVLKEKFGVEVKGKSIDAFAEAYKDKVISEAKIEPNEKIKGLETDLEKIKGNYNELEGNFNTYKSDIEAKQTQQQKNQTLLKYMPDGLLVDNDIALMALKTKLGVDVLLENGKAFHTINGEIQKDKSLEPIELSKDFMSEQLKSLNLTKPKQGGNGGGDESGGNGGESDYEKFTKRMADNGIIEGGQEFNEKMQEELKAGTLKL